VKTPCCSSKEVRCVDMKNIDLPGSDKDRRIDGKYAGVTPIQGHRRDNVLTIFEASLRDKPGPAKSSTQVGIAILRGQLIKIWHSFEIRMPGPMANNPAIRFLFKQPTSSASGLFGRRHDISTSPASTREPRQRQNMPPSDAIRQESAFVPHSQSNIPIVSAVAIPVVSGDAVRISRVCSSMKRYAS
jgi:hypothetical protein